MTNSSEMLTAAIPDLVALTDSDGLAGGRRVAALIGPPTSGPGPRLYAHGLDAAELVAFRLGGDSVVDIIEDGVRWDEIVHLHDPWFDEATEMGRARALAVALATEGRFDVIVCGPSKRAPSMASQLGSLLAVPTMSCRFASGPPWPLVGPAPVVVVEVLNSGVPRQNVEGGPLSPPTPVRRVRAHELGLKRFELEDPHPQVNPGSGAC